MPENNKDTKITSKPALVTDLNPSYIQENQYSHARNIIRSSRDGDLGSLSNEPSLINCISAPYPIVGLTPLENEDILIFSGDGNNSEIGLGNYSTCSYKTLKNLKCFSFSTDYPVKAVAKRDFSKGVIVTFTDKNSPVRRIELNKIGNIESCDDILLFKKIKHPCLNVKKGNIGNMPDGSYSVLIAYSVDGNIFSDWMSLTERVQLNAKSGSSSIDVEITNLDTEFQYYSIAVVGTYIDPVTQGVTKSAKIIGEFSTAINKVSVSDFINSTYIDINLSTLVAVKKTWNKAGVISSNSQYLILGDLVANNEENYVPKAREIQVEYVVEQVPLEYYITDGKDLGYYRDENYDFYIQGVYNTGEYTERFHIPGRKKKSSDSAIATGPDVIEFDKLYNCGDVDKVETWRVKNTAGKMIPENNEFVCNRRIIGRGEMGYYESSLRYPNNPIWGEDANTPYRFHKMPDESKVKRYEIIDGKVYINIIGVRFKNIQPFDNPNIIGIKITRSDRKGGNGTVNARGIMTNVRSYTDQFSNQEILYTNYTVNDLRPDAYLSSTQTSFRNRTEQNFNPLSTYYKDRFNFYSPHTLFEPRYSLGNEIKIESVETANITGRFEPVFNHPKQKLLTQFSFWVAAAVGFIETSLTLLGKGTYDASQVLDTSITAGARFNFGRIYSINTVGDLIGLNIIEFITDAIKAAAFDKIGSAIRVILTSLASLGLKIPYSLFAGIKQANDIIDIIYNLTGYTNYTYQYNAKATFRNSIPVQDGNKRRLLSRPAVYIPSDVVSIDNITYNNSLREPTVYFELNKEIEDPQAIDNSRNTISGFGICDDISRAVNSLGSVFYVTNKVANPNQYGQLGSSNIVPLHSCPLAIEDTSVLYGGDCVIAEMSFRKKMQFFRQDLANTNYPDGVEYDYRLYPNIGYPRFWMDSSRYDFSDVLSGNVVNFTRFSRTTTSKYNLDCKENDKRAPTRIDDAYMYLSNNCLLEFIVETDANIWFRENNNKNISEIFRSDKLSQPEEFQLSRAYFDIYPVETFSLIQRIDFDPLNPIPVDQPNSVIYSLPSYNLQNVDNWQYFLPANYFSFRESDFGKLTAIHKLDQDRVIFLFSRSSPYISMGRDFLELEGSGRKITIGDGGLFAQDPREVMPTDNNFGACTSKYAFSNTHLGRFYPSSNQGRILSFTEGLNDISQRGMSFWCKNYMPIFLYDYFPTYTREENPIGGVGYLTAFDSYYETFYITKRDFIPKKEFKDDITYENGSFFYRGNRISLRSNYFQDVSWTLSYSPLDEAFVSWHDWHPDLTMQTDNHFLSVKNNTVWKHNESYDSFCNFYNIQYPFEIEFISNTGKIINTVRNIEYYIEAYSYKNFGRDRFHVLNENFDHLIVWNTEQISPLLKLVHASPNPEVNLGYPRKSSNISYDVLFFKEENKYRINQFWDSTKDRGEFSNNEYHLFPTDLSGYKNVINPVAINIDKSEEQRKKFRHYWNKFRFIKADSKNIKFIIKLADINKQYSQR